jgi:hypothetical protein
MHLTSFHKTLRFSVYIHAVGERFFAPSDVFSLTGRSSNFSCKLSSYPWHISGHPIRICFASSKYSTNISPAAEMPILFIIFFKNRQAKRGLRFEFLRQEPGARDRYKRRRITSRGRSAWIRKLMTAKQIINNWILEVFVTGDLRMCC